MDALQSGLAWAGETPSSREWGTPIAYTLLAASNTKDNKRRHQQRGKLYKLFASTQHRIVLLLQSKASILCKAVEARYYSFSKAPEEVE